jgi:dTDP-glucose 4,6-dehydratase
MSPICDASIFMPFAHGFKKRIVVTGGAGFIGSNLLLFLVPKYDDNLYINVDCLTYAGNLANLVSIEKRRNYRFEKINIRCYKELENCFDRYDVNGVIHLAAESHVDRSIYGPADFIGTNIEGTFNLLELARRRGDDLRFHHVSTDEVYGSLGNEESSAEDTVYRPNSPYSASKAASDHLVRAYYHTYRLDTVTTNCTNNFGPYQFPEKLIPLTIRHAYLGLPIPVYGDGRHIRDWLYVEDHCRAIDLVFNEGKSGMTYNVGADNQMENLDIIKRICRVMDDILGGKKREDLITFVPDRPGHDRRYATDATLIKKDLGWGPQYEFQRALKMTVRWYLDNLKWLEDCISGEYKKYYAGNYLNRQGQHEQENK